ncbi:MAG: hypothetical protein MUF20_14285 [Methylotetracoccus sp.]|jgi:hypothetical protein|nr:hypothetical protein [Methylotetracoccus sp.]
MLAKVLRPGAAERGPLIDHIGQVLIDRAVATGRWATTEVPVHLTAIRRSIGNAYDMWWLSLPWWQMLWLSGSVERRFQTFTDYAQQCGLLDKWLRRAVSGMHAVSAADQDRSLHQQT